MSSGWRSWPIRARRGAGDQALDLGLACDVAGKGFGAKVSRRGGKRPGVDIGQQQLRALGGKGAGDSLADPARRAGNDRALAVEAPGRGHRQLIES